MVLHNCDVCTKMFKLKTDLERHKNRKNKCVSKEIDVIEPIINTTQNAKNTTKSVDSIKKNEKINTQIPQEPQKRNTSETYCKNCDKKFARLDSLKRHQLLYCIPKEDEPVVKNDNKDVIDLLLKMDKKHTQEITELKNTIIDLKLKIKSESTNTTINNNSNNINSNNTIFVSFRDENAACKLSERDIEQILCVHESGLIQRCVEVVHFNNKYPEFQNAYIADKKMKYAQVYNSVEKKFNIKDATSAVKCLASDSLDCLYDLSIKEDVCISDKKRRYIDDKSDNFMKIPEVGSESEKKDYETVMNDLKLLLYNNRDKVLITHKQLEESIIKP